MFVFIFAFQLYWENLITPSNWSGPILIRSGTYLKSIEQLIVKYSTRVAHNSLIVLFTLGLLPENEPNAAVCTKATMWAMPEITSALFVSQYSDQTIDNIVERVSDLGPNFPVFFFFQFHLNFMGR